MPPSVRPHPERAAYLARATALGWWWDRPATFDLFRFINPHYPSPVDIIGGKGARYAAGRWNLPGNTSKLSYTATEPETALAETLAHARYFRLPSFSALPRVLVGLRLRATRVLDLREGALRRKLHLRPKTDISMGLATPIPSSTNAQMPMAQRVKFRMRNCE